MTENEELEERMNEEMTYTEEEQAYDRLVSLYEELEESCD